MMRRFVFVFSIFPAFLCANANANTKARVASILFEGNQTTREWVLEKELLVHVGDEYNEQNFTDSVQNIRNLRIFKSVEGSVERNSDNTVNLKIQIAEKQTLLPFFRLKKGGGSTLVVLGIGDLNTLGRGFEFLPMYENLNGKYHGGRLDVRFPRVFEFSTALDASIATETRSRTLFSENGSVEKTFLTNQNSGRLAFEHHITPRTHILTSLLVQKVKAGSVNVLSTFAHTSLGVSLGSINYNDYLLSGSQASFRIEHISSQSEPSIVNAHLDWKGFWNVHKTEGRFSVATRFVAQAAITPTTIFHQCRIGGFGEVRGFLDERYRGNTCWFANLEARNRLVSSSWYVLQSAIFTDAGAFGEKASQTNFQWQKSPASAGAGVRIIFPHLARLILRADVAKPVSPHKSPMGISLGSTQFF
jgi:outer membrane protein assembly factor BamA